MMPQKIYYWKGCVNQARFVDYQKTIDQVLFGDYQSADLDLKTLKNASRVYTARINDADRLLFKTLVVDGQPQMLLLDVITNHDYTKSKYFRRHAAQTPSATLPEWDAIESQELWFAKPVQGKRCDHDYTLIPVYDYNQQFITFNADQDDALVAPLPMILSGPPGSGKTCVAMAMLTQFMQGRDVSVSKKVLYVTESQRLTHRLQAMWDEMHIDEPRDVVFLSYNDVLISLVSTGERALVSRDDFAEWFPRFIQQVKTILKGLKKPTQACDVLAAVPVKQIYQEFRILSSYSKEDYLTLGKRASLFRDLELRQMLYQALAAYLVKLKNDGIIHPAFHRPSETGVFDAIVVDEAQDFSLLQLSVLNQLTTGSRIVYNLDSNQSLNDSKSRRPFLEQLFFNESKTVTSVYLTGTYRCPHVVIHFANALLRLRDTLRGGAAEKGGVTAIEFSSDPVKATGKVYWFDPTMTVQADWQNHLHTIPQFSLQCAVITSDEYKDEARRTLNTSLVFTAEEIKGLEYPWVILYRPFDRPFFKDANKRLLNMEVLSHAASHLPTQEDDLFSECFNQVFTAATRATENVTLYQAHDSHGLGQITHYLKHHCSIPSQSDDNAATSTPQRHLEPVLMGVAEREALCLREVKRLLENENDEQARALFLSQLSGKSDADYQQLKAHCVPNKKTVIAPVASGSSAIARHSAVKRATKVQDAPVRPPVAPDPLQSADYFLKQFTHENVMDVLNRPYAVHYLFQGVTFSNHHDQLILHILGNKRRAEIFLEALKQTLERDPDDLLRSQLKTCFDPGTGTSIMQVIVGNMHMLDAKKILYQLRIRDEVPLDLLNCQNMRGETLIHALVRVNDGNSEHYKKLINRGANINLPTHDGVSPLFLAVMLRHAKVIKILLDRGAEVNCTDNDGLSPLNYLISQYEMHHLTLELVELLINHHADINFSDRRCSNSSALQLAIVRRDRALVSFLMKNGADINHRNSDGLTALDLAIVLGDREILRQLAVAGPIAEAHTAELIDVYKPGVRCSEAQRNDVYTRAYEGIDQRRQYIITNSRFFSAPREGTEPVIEPSLSPENQSMSCNSVQSPIY